MNNAYPRGNLQVVDLRICTKSKQKTSNKIKEN